MARQPKKSSFELMLQMLFNFILPILVLTRFSEESSLGPTRSLLLALSFPIVYEFYNVIKNKKLSWISVISVGGILVTGTLSLLELSVTWLAVRRSVPYVVITIGILVSERLFKISPTEKIAVQILNMNKVMKHMNNKVDIQKLFSRTSYIAAGLFGVIAVDSYFLTRLIVTSPTNTSLFNQQYASLRLWSIAGVTIPILVGSIAIIWYLVSSIEKLTGLKTDEILN